MRRPDCIWLGRSFEFSCQVRNSAISNLKPRSLTPMLLSSSSTSMTITTSRRLIATLVSHHHHHHQPKKVPSSYVSLFSSAKQRAFSSSSNTSSSSSLLAGDTGTKATHLHHKLTTALALATPLYLLAPLSADSIINKAFGLGIATVTAGHSWIGLNYVATDYVPKISKSLVGPARLVNAALAVLTFVGLSRIALNDAGGIRGTVLGLWKLPQAAAEEEEQPSPPLPMRGLANPDSLGRA